MHLHCTSHDIHLEIEGTIRRITLPPVRGHIWPKVGCALLLNGDVEHDPDLLRQGKASVRVRGADGQETDRTCEVEVR